MRGVCRLPHVVQRVSACPVSVKSLSQSSCSQSACPTSSPLPSRCPGQTPNLVWLGLVRGRPFSSPAQALCSNHFIPQQQAHVCQVHVQRA